MTDNRIARPEDDYSPDWPLYWAQNPHLMRAVGADTAEGEPAEDPSGEPAEPAEAPETPETPEPTGDDPGGSWRDAIQDETLRKTAEKFTDPEALLKSYREAEKRISQGFKVPDENASDKEKQKFREALGIPDEPTGYTIPKPEHLDEETFNSDAVQQPIQSFLEKMHAQGAPDSVVQEAIGTYWQVQAEAQKAIADHAEQQAEQAREALKSKWGDEYDKNVSFATQAAKRMFDDFDGAREMQLRDGSYLLDNPTVLEAFAKIGREMGEDTIGSALTDDEKQSMESRFQDLTAQIHEADRRGDKQKLKQLSAERDDLSAKLFGTEPITGR